MEQTYFILNTRRVPVTITDVEEFGKQYFELSFSYNPNLINEIKESTELRQWQKETKTWRLEKSLRNKFVLSFLKGENPYWRYDLHNDDTKYTLPEDFWGHQVNIFKHEIMYRRCIIAGETRVGKTRPTLELIKILNCKDAWWVAPKSALKGLKIQLNQWDFPYNLFLLTYDAFRNKMSKLTERALIESVPQVIVFDEAHKLKNPRSIQGQTARDVANAQRIKYEDDSYTILLSGTPAPKDPSDWWNLTEVCCPGFLREGSQTALKKRLGEFEQREGRVGQQYWHLIKWKKEEVEFLNKRLEGISKTFLRKDCLDLPEKIRTVINLDTPSEYYKAARMIRKIELNPAQLQMKLRLISDGIMYISDIDMETAKKVRTETKFFPNCPKDSQLINDLEEFEDVGRVIVANAFKGTMDKLIKICINQNWAVLKIDGGGWAALNTCYSVDECLKEMDGSNTKSLIRGKDGNFIYKIPKLVTLINQVAGSTGLELSASPIIINYSLAFNAADQEQMEGRAYSNNMDKVKGLEIRTYINLPIDKLILDNIERKKSLQSITMGDIDKAMENIF